MELTMTNGFCELTMDEMNVVDGGKVSVAGAFDEVCKTVTATAAGCIVASICPGGALAYMAGAVVGGVVVYVWENI